MSTHSGFIIIFWFYNNNSSSLASNKYNMRYDVSQANHNATASNLNDIIDIMFKLYVARLAYYSLLRIRRQRHNTTLNTRSFGLRLVCRKANANAKGPRRRNVRRRTLSAEIMHKYKFEYYDCHVCAVCVSACVCTCVSLCAASDDTCARVCLRTPLLKPPSALGRLCDCVPQIV